LASREEVYEQVREILVERLDIDEADVTEEASLRDDLKADSLDLVELIMDLEERFGVKISDDEAQAIGTVGEAVSFIVTASD
jgi:acyl carrier protein